MGGKKSKSQMRKDCDLIMPVLRRDAEMGFYGRGRMWSGFSKGKQYSERGFH